MVPLSSGQDLSLTTEGSVLEMVPGYGVECRLRRAGGPGRNTCLEDGLGVCLETISEQGEGAYSDAMLTGVSGNYGTMTTPYPAGPSRPPLDCSPMRKPYSGRLSH